VLHPERLDDGDEEVVAGVIIRKVGGGRNNMGNAIEAQVVLGIIIEGGFSFM